MTDSQSFDFQCFELEEHRLLIAKIRKDQEYTKNLLDKMRDDREELFELMRHRQEQDRKERAELREYVRSTLASIQSTSASCMKCERGA